MTTMLDRLDVDRAPIPPRIFRSVVATTALITAASMAATPNDVVSATVIVLVIALFGIPHGAVDHLVAATFQTAEPSPSHLGVATWTRKLRFHLAYVAAMAAYGIVWLAAPTVALIAFLLLSVHHFGQSDLAYLRIGRWPQFSIQLSRGLFLVGLVLVADIAAVGPVIERMGGFDPASWPWLAGHTIAWSAALVGQHLAVGLIIARRVRDRTAILREIITVIVLAALFIATDPLIGFAVYFGLWHSLSHLNVLADVLGRRAGPAALTPRQLARLCVPRSLVSIAALTVAIAAAQVFRRTELIVPIALVFISMLTLPHMIVVERLWRSKSSQRNSDEPQLRQVPPASAAF